MSGETKAKQASWDGKSSSLSTFIKDLFSTDVRSSDAVTKAVLNGDKNYSFTDDATRGLILNAWLAAWQKHQNDKYDSDAYNRCPKTDRDLLGFLSDYIKSSGVAWHVPDISYTGTSTPDGTVGVYNNNGYDTRSFFNGKKWNYGKVSSTGTLSNGGDADDTVANFLLHFFYGAHIVVISNADDLGGAKATQFLKAFTSSSLKIADDPTNSHYSGANLTGKYYLDIDSDSEPSSGPLIAAFLSALTDPATKNDIVVLLPDHTGAMLEQMLKKRHEASNSFIQLEGWQARASLDDWHMLDYDSSTATLWNFSTFGACAYAEKRSTPLFLAPPGFSVVCDSTTHMPLYNGAIGQQLWMNPSLMTIPAKVGPKPTPQPPPNQ